MHQKQLLKTVWEKKKLPVTSNFFFSYNVSYSVRKLYPHLTVCSSVCEQLLKKYSPLKLISLKLHRNDPLVMHFQKSSTI